MVTPAVRARASVPPLALEVADVHPRRGSLAGSEPPRPYIVMPYAALRNAEGAVVAHPEVLAHAKVVGSRATLCGRASVSFTAYLDQPFESYEGNRCDLCVGRVQVTPGAVSGQR